MNLTVVLVLIMIAILLLIFKARTGATGKINEWPFYGKKVLTPPEQILYFRLLDALPDHVILAQVQLSRFLGVKKGHNFHAWNNRINRMSADFLICQKDSSVVAAIELDDSTHEKKKRKEADQKKDAAIAAAGIPMVRWKVTEIPSVEEITNSLAGIHSTRNLAG